MAQKSAQRVRKINKNDGENDGRDSKNCRKGEQKEKIKDSERGGRMWERKLEKGRKGSERYSKKVLEGPE